MFQPDDSIYPKGESRRSQAKTDYKQTSQQGVVKKIAVQPATFTLKRHLGGKTLKAWRKAHNLSAHDLALELGVSRSYIKSIEGGSLEASQKIIQRFDALRTNRGEAPQPQTNEPKPVTVVCRFELPASFEILAKPRRCKGCRKFFVPITPNQKMHSNAKCKRAARRRKPKQKR